MKTAMHSVWSKKGGSERGGGCGARVHLPDLGRSPRLDEAGDLLPLSALYRCASGGSWGVRVSV